MANFQINLHLFLFLTVALIACLKTQLTEARQLKAMNQFTSIKMGTAIPIQASKTLQKPGNSAQIEQIPPTQTHEAFSSSDGLEPTTPGNSPGVGHRLAVQKHNMQDFTPAADQKDSKGPGHSPGVGHHLAVQKIHNMQDFASVADQKDDPEGPGHSPGVGHRLAVQKIHNMQDFTSVADQKDDPKGPGHSPGVGHSAGHNMQDFTSVADQKDDPKGPGHSPGVGHSAGPKP